jgi:CheY-like chemotaxis protein
MITAKSMEEDRFGFELGADDYICKPFSIQELLAYWCFLRRTRILHSEKPLTFQIGTITFYIVNSGSFRKDVHDMTQREGITSYSCVKIQTDFWRGKKFLLKSGARMIFIWAEAWIYTWPNSVISQADESIRIETIHGIGFRFHAVIHSQNNTNSA